VVVEVVSPRTERSDRGAKAIAYRQRASIDAIVFVATDEQRVEVHTRNPDGTWTLTEAREGDIAVPPLGVRLPIAEVYAGFDALAPPA
jgi:Uma2 family endonuclease